MSRRAASSSSREARGARERVLEAACRCIEAKGWNEASLGDILAEARVSTSNFYYHWKSKDDLGLAVVRQLTVGLEVTVVRGIFADAERSPLERIRAWVSETQRKLAAHGCTRGCPFGRLSSELSGSRPIFRKELERAFALYRSALESCVREGIERGEIRVGIDPGRASSLMLAAVQGLVLLAKSERDVAVYRSGADELVRWLEAAPLTRRKR